MKTIAVVGLGLIGGSIVKKLKKDTDYRLIGVSGRQETADRALQEGLIAEGSIDISLVKDADVIFVTVPVNKTIPILKDVFAVAKQEAIITDGASVKSSIMEFVNANLTPVNFIGGHPMAGTENKGLESSFAELFEGAKWVLTPSKWATLEDMHTLAAIIKQLGAETITADPLEHDRAVALISHMPLLLSQALYSLVAGYPDEGVRELAMQLAASGFRDMTRIAATNPELTLDMLGENKENIVAALEKLIMQAGSLSTLLDNRESYSEVSCKIADSRRMLYSPDGKNVFGHKS
ncbi:MAG: prephenate dehydrogenase/arogenate dehydrogenase family protein [Candidatus Gastranaerophilales bacterium]|nr:prephenate dehydrogenase/arogenate dehydrogenase family protein [Candidatus Gastranaerophilales bacterium]